jgi:phosphoglycolate phosphatase-like HAD superfamily hydrolase
MPRKLPVRDVVVLLPGILGSVLQRDRRDVWALSKGAIWRGLVTLGDNVKDLRLDRDDPTAPDLGDGVEATRLMPDAHLIPGFWKIDGYTKIKDVLFMRFEFEEGVNWFDFPYDWRRDNRAAAHRLSELAPGWLDAWKTRSGADDAKLILVGHSMGGLVARHYLEVLGGWEQTRFLVTFGTPYRGSVNALDFLANGFKKGFGPFKADLSDLLRSLTSVHQLLPTYACLDDGTGDLQKIAEATGLPAGIDLEKVGAAAVFHDEIADAVIRNGGYGRYDIAPVVGIFQPTSLSAQIRGGKLTSLQTYEGEDDGGDGTVPRVSATPLELSDDPRESYATEAHASLQNFDAVLVQLMGVLTRKSLAAYRGSPFEGFRLEVDDIVSPGEPLEVGVVTGGPAVSVAVAVENVDTNQRVEGAADLDDDGRGTLMIGPLEAGVYRVTARDPDESGIKPVTDLLVVGDDVSAERAAAEAGAG